MPAIKDFQCVNGCNVFQTIGLPSFCPFCGSREVFETDETVTKYETMDEAYENANTP